MSNRIDLRQFDGATEGPWTVPHFAQPDVNCQCKYVLCDPLLGAVATVHCSGEGDNWAKNGDNPKFAAACANARLIAAAPTLLAELRRMYEVEDGLREVLIAAKRLNDEVLPKFNWGASALDANAIRLLNDVPVMIVKALAERGS